MPESLKMRDPRVDTQVWTAAARLSTEQLEQPEWLWFVRDGTEGIPVARYSFGRWAKVAGQAPYVRADIALAVAGKLHDETALTQAEARGRAAGRREALEEAAKVASNDAGELHCSTSVATAERIMDAIRALIPTQPTALVSLDRTEGGR